MTTPVPHMRLRQRAQGLAATVAILVLVAGVPFLLLAIGAAPWNADLRELRTLLSSPDDGTLAMVVIAAIAWIAWLVVAVSVAIETAALVRGLPAPSLPGLGSPQGAVGQLVAVAALLFVAAPTVMAAFPTAPVHAATAAPLPHAPRLAVIEASPVLPEATPVLATADTLAKETRERSTIDYTVKRGDSLWKIADRLLGDGARFPEIVDLNRDVLHGRADFIISGTVLKVPNEATDTDAAADPVDRPADEYVVQPRDTLSGIADDTLGDPTRYPELFEASHNTVQPDGATLTDPDLIRPGWGITIPQQTRRHAEVADDPVHVMPPAPVKPDVTEPPPTPPTTASPEAELSAAAADDTDDSADSAESDDASVPGWLVPGLTGAGAVLAALVLLAVRAHRHTQLRYRRPGQTIAPPPPELRAVERTAMVSGAPLTATIEQLDLALRHLAGIYEDEGRALPSIETVTLARGTATLRLAEEANLPGPWTGAGLEWSTRLEDRVPDRDVIPPYPLLVTVGQDDAGALHLVNLEHLRVASLAGDPTTTTALARHIAAELALNPWSVLVEVTVIGLGEELATIDPLRLHHHTDGEKVIASLARSLTSARESGSGDPDPYRAVITAGDGTFELAALLSSPVPRLGAAVISLGAPVPDSTGFGSTGFESTVFEVDHTRRLRAPALGLDLRAAGLTSQEAAACAAIVDLTRDSEPVPVAAFEPAADGWRALADQAGALRVELTDVREEGPAGKGSLLPHATAQYADLAATTPQDVETLAPVVPDQVRRTVKEADPTLDEDVTAWFDPESRQPRLLLLGAVNAEAFGVVAPVITKRRPYFVEILAFLALRPQGATGSAVADAFGVAASRARTDLGSLREWLGQNPRTGGPHLPAANDSPTYRETGVKTYQVQDVLVDLDLFRRLRTRGQARGTTGIEDLKTAMSLVEGQPFSLLRERGWGWLLDGDRLHETIGCAIVDTAHILVVDALARDDLAFARQTAETACTAAPYDDICRLDLVKVATAEGREEAADRMLTDDVFNRTDDHLPPIDLPERTGEVVGKQDWGSARRRPTT